jgi:hypothetical protein
LREAQTLTDSRIATTQYHCLSLVSSKPNRPMAGTGMPSGPPVHVASLRSTMLMMMPRPSVAIAR